MGRQVTVQFNQLEPKIAQVTISLSFFGFKDLFREKEKIEWAINVYSDAAMIKRSINFGSKWEINSSFL